MDMFACLDAVAESAAEQESEEKMPLPRLRWYTWSQVLGLTKSLMTGHGNAEVAGNLDEQLLESRKAAVELGLLQDLNSDQLYGPNEDDYNWLEARAKMLGLEQGWLASYHGPKTQLRAADLDWETFRRVDEDLSAFEFGAYGIESKRRTRKKKDKTQEPKVAPAPPAPTWDEICDYAELSEADPEKFAPTMYNQKIRAYAEAHGIDSTTLHVHFGALTNEFESMSCDHLNAFACWVQEMIENMEKKKCESVSASGGIVPSVDAGTGATPAEESQPSSPATQDPEIRQSQPAKGQGDYTVTLETGEVLDLHWFLQKFGFTEMPTSLTEQQVEAIGEAIEVYNHRADKLREQAELRAKPLAAKANALRNFYSQLLFAWGEPRLARTKKGDITEWNVKTATCTLHFESSPDVSIIDEALYKSWKAKAVAEGKQGDFGITVKVEHSIGLDQLRSLLKGKKASGANPAVAAIAVPGCKIVPRKAIVLKSVK